MVKCNKYKIINLPYLRICLENKIQIRKRYYAAKRSKKEERKFNDTLANDCPF